MMMKIYDYNHAFRLVELPKKKNDYLHEAINDFFGSFFEINFCKNFREKKK